MLVKFEVENFKKFKDTFTFDLSNVKNYEFNAECVKDETVNKSIIYGVNGVGKSNLGLALFDIVAHLTDKYFNASLYTNYLNANGIKKPASFKYYFKFQGVEVVYGYSKRNISEVIQETLKIDGKEVINYSVGKLIETNLEGTESLNKDLGDSKLSALKYIKRNAILKEGFAKVIFDEFYDFVENMLFFKSLDYVVFIGYKNTPELIGNTIINDGNLEDFEKFLNESSVECKLSYIELNGDKNITFNFGDIQLDFWSIASTGTRSLTLFYFWYKELQKSKFKSLIFIDEFDAFYHHRLSYSVVKRLIELDAQVILTTHDINIMSNDLMRPDCYFIMSQSEISSISQKTKKELRVAHNLEKMYRAGSVGN